MEKFTANYLASVNKLFRYYKKLGDGALAQLPDDKINWEIAPNSNSVAVIVKHLKGNMLSRWTNFLSSDGEKQSRNRDDEFEDTIRTKTELLAVWEQGWHCLFTAIDPLQSSDFEQLVYIRNEGHTITEALNRQLGHYAYHVGQIVFLVKAIVGNQWQSLSIPKGQSQVFNTKKFEQNKQRRNFVDGML
jgi:hypothetical protein